jgi:hypothetical protein
MLHRRGCAAGPAGDGPGYGDCVEVAELPGGSVGARHSKDPDGPVLQFTRGALSGIARRRQDERDGTAWDRRQPLLAGRAGEVPSDART